MKTSPFRLLPLNLIRVIACVAAGALASTAMSQTFGVYEDQLENAWQNWSWASTNLASTTYVYSGTYSAEITYTGAWQGFYLDCANSLPAANFAALTFYINGGPNAGRSIGVAAINQNGALPEVNLNNYIAGGSVAANTWRKVTIPISALGLASTDLVSGFWLQETSGSAQPSFWVDSIEWQLVAPPKTTTVVVNPMSSLRKVDQKLFGVNTAVWDSVLPSPACTSLIAAGGYKAFRFPGGSLSDGYNWLTNTTDSNSWTWPVDFDQFAAVASPAKGQCFITANYGTGTPAEAAAWVAYSNQTKKYGFKYWEIGNEVYGTWEEDSHAHPNDPVTYAQQFAQYYAQMKAKDPTISVGAVATPGEDAYVNYPSEVVTNPRTGQKHSGWTPVMLATLAGLGVTPDFIIYHRYPEYVTESDLPLLTGNGGWSSDTGNMRQQLKDYLGAKNTSVQIMCTENNADAGNPGKQMCSLVNGLYLADSFGTILQTELNSYMWWDLINGQSTTGDQSPWLYGWRPYGDEGVFAPDLSTTYPVYYIEQLLNDFAATDDTVLTAVSNYQLLTAYATKRADGSLRVLIVNKNPTLTIPVTFQLGSYMAQSSQTLYSYGIPQDNNAKNGLPQNVAVSTIHTSTAALTIGPYSANVIVFTPARISTPQKP